MATLEEQILNDSALYLEELKKKFEVIKGLDAPVPTRAGNSYIRGYRKYNGTPFVLKLSRFAIAYLYKQLFDESTQLGRQITGDLAIALANYNPEELPTPTNPGQSDPSWDPSKAYQNSVMLGFWDDSKGIKPFKIEFKVGKGTQTVEFYDDWHQEWP